jgi:hypothetical protein
MPAERQQRTPPRERTFAEVFPWRNIRRAVMLVFLIVAIVVIKRSAGRFLTRVGEMWGAPAPTATQFDHRTGVGNRRIRLGPGLAPAASLPVTGGPSR